MTRTIAFRIDDEVYKRFKVLCVELNLSPPKQTEALIIQFVKIHEENNKNIKKENNYVLGNFI